MRSYMLNPSKFLPTLNFPFHDVCHVSGFPISLICVFLLFYQQVLY
nr:MAG TPA: hypothetical protein [Bacteriophage sp.]